MKTEILRILRNEETAVSGQRLCELLGKSRTAVWKVMKQLEEEGYEIEAVQNKGYKILSYPDVVTKEELESRMAPGQTVYYFPEVGSTNEVAKQLAGEGAADNSLVVAEVQKTGKGRRGRGWESPAGTGIFMTLIRKPDIHPAKASMMTLVMALAVVAGIRKVTGLEAQIKWPNDVLLNGKKVCGILTEMSAETEAIHYVVIGAGINVNTVGFLAEIADRATSVYQVRGESTSRAALIVAITEAFDGYYQKFLEREDLSLLQEEYQQRLINLEKEVAVEEPEGTFTGVAIGINENGELLVRGADGKVKNIFAGEVSVRGVYGYV